MTRIRPATPGDRSALLAIQAASLATPQPELLELGIENPVGADTTVFVAGEEPVGYALVVGRDPVDLVELAVAPDHRGMGHGSALLERVRDRGAVRLTARADAGLRKFYERHGFRVVERLPDYYADADGIVFETQSESAD